MFIKKYVYASIALGIVFLAVITVSFFNKKDSNIDDIVVQEVRLTEEDAVELRKEVGGEWIPLNDMQHDLMIVAVGGSTATNTLTDSQAGELIKQVNF